MKCPFCGTQSRVLYTRGARRRRACLGLKQHRFTTEETVVVKRISDYVQQKRK